MSALAGAGFGPRSPEFKTVGGPLEDEVIRPDVVRTLWPATHEGAVSQPRACPLGLFRWDTEPLLAPETFHPLVMGAGWHTLNDMVRVTHIGFRPELHCHRTTHCRTSTGQQPATV